MYEYRARITRVIDGDTVEAEIDLGFHVTLTVTLRLAGINAPETRGKERPRGLAATRYLESLLDDLAGDMRVLTVRTRKDVTEKYGRYLAFRLFTSQVDADRKAHLVRLEGGPAGKALTLFLDETDLGLPSPNVWKQYRVRLDPSARWKLATGKGHRPATQAEIRTVLANVTALRIAGEFSSGKNEGRLDYVVFGAEE